MERWCRKPFRFGPPLETRKKKHTEFDHVDFSKPGDEEFWDRFPKRELPEQAVTRVDVGELEKLIEEMKGKMTIHDVDMAQKAIKHLKEGAPAHQLTSLPGITVKNAPSIAKCAPEFTETLKKWVGAGYAAGPFTEKPSPDLRVRNKRTK